MLISCVFLAACISCTASAASSLADVCTTTYARAALPSTPGLGITIDPNSLNATSTSNQNVSGQVFYPNGQISYCSVIFSYSHSGLNDSVLVEYWMPAPAAFQNRYLSTGGGGYMISSGSMSLPGGILYGAVAGTTDGGFGSFATSFDSVFLLANNSINYPALNMFGYQAHHELSVIGKAFTRKFYAMKSSTKLYSYYQGCSEGGREGWSQIQRYGHEWDGATIGAPAFRYSFQQANHLYSNIVEHTVGYYPSPCEFEKIVNETIAACDPMDGNTDGVVARTDLCKLNFNLDTIVGKPYACAAITGTGGSPKRAVKRQFTPPSPAPAQNGTVSSKGVEVARLIIQGLRNLDGEQVYLSYQPSADFNDAATQYNSTSKSWELEISAFGGEWITRFLRLQNTSTLASLRGVTYNTLAQWMVQGFQMYSSTLQTDWPDLTSFQKAGGKVIHFHGESDNSIPPASSVRYWDSVRQIMYANSTYNASAASLNEWYRLYLVPGAAHCAINSEQPNGPFPQTNLAVLINWVEKGVTPTTLNATHLAGANIGKNAQLCAWPLRPIWKSNGTTMDCVYDQASIDSWTYHLDGVKMPIY